MIEKNKRRMDYWNVKKIIDETIEQSGIKEPTAKDVLHHILGDKEGWSGSDYVIYKYSDNSKRNFIQRVNTIWVYPLFIITIPFQFLFLGNCGVNRNSKIGKLINWLIKFD